MNLGSHGKPYKMEINGRTLYLCCKGCAKAVKKDPEAAFEEDRSRKAEGPEGVRMRRSRASLGHSCREAREEDRPRATPRSAPMRTRWSREATRNADRRPRAPVCRAARRPRRRPRGGDARSRKQKAAADDGADADKPITPGESDGLTAEQRANLEKLPERIATPRWRKVSARSCGMKLGSMGEPYKMEINGRALYLCGQGCEESVKDDPDAAFEKIEAAKCQQH